MRNFTIVGILNMTPDSFSDGGDNSSLDKALRHVEQMIDEGASMIDVGGESTRPGYVPVSWQEEVTRIEPVIREIKKNFDVEISVDTYRPETWQAAIEMGADVLNDIWGLQSDERLAQITAKYEKKAVLMHNRDNLITDDFINEWLMDMRAIVKRAKSYGIKDENIILDPGVGFAKTHEQNVQVIANLYRLKELGYPIYLGTSRKRVLKKISGKERPKDLDPSTAATSVLGYMQGVEYFRVHNVDQTCQALKVARAVIEESDFKYGFD